MKISNVICRIKWVSSSRHRRVSHGVRHRVVRRAWLSTLVIVLALVSGALGPATTLRAQDTGTPGDAPGDAPVDAPADAPAQPPSTQALESLLSEQSILQITGIDTTDFPDVEVSVYGDNLSAPLPDVPLSLREDTREIAVESRETAEVGVQVALVLDASNNIRNPGNIAGTLRYQDYQASVDALVEAGVLSAQTDWLGAYATGPSEEAFRIISDWTQDHGALRNDVLLYTPEDDTAQTPLFDLVEFTLDQFEDTELSPNLKKSIIIFSDGFDATSNLDRNDVIRRAQEMNVTIYTVMVMAEDDERRTNLERIATLTDGRYVFLDAIETLGPLWTEIGEQRQQELLRYRTDDAQPVELELSAQPPGEVPLVRSRAFPATGAEPVVITVLNPADGEAVIGDADAGSESAVLPIEVEFSWPDGYPRALQRVEYTVNDDTRVVDSGPFDQFDFPLGDLPSGRYTLRVAAIDELGLMGSAVPLPVQIQAPAPLPTAVPTPVPEEPAPNLALIGALLRGILLLGAGILLVGWLLWRRRRRVDEESRPPSEISLGPGNIPAEDEWSQAAQPMARFDDATEIPAEPPFTPKPAAQLVAVEKISHLPQRITLRVGSVVRIGRRGDLCDVVLDDKRISRAHAIITHREDGFHIQDDGSKGGTYVNQRQLTVSDDRLLRDNDIVNFHAVGYRFEREQLDHTEVPDELFMEGYEENGRGPAKVFDPDDVPAVENNANGASAVEFTQTSVDEPTVYVDDDA